jgi:F-type H+-transporting ATPase subunit b
LEDLLPQIWHLVWTVFNFAVLLFILGKFLYKPLLGMMTKREEEISGNIARAEADVKAAQDLKKDFEQQIQGVQVQARQIIADAQAAASRQSEQILADAMAAQEEMKKRAEESIRQERDAAIGQLRGEIASMAVEVATKVIGRTITSEDHKRMVDEFVEEAIKH